MAKRTKLEPRSLMLPALNANVAVKVRIDTSWARWKGATAYRDEVIRGKVVRSEVWDDPDTIRLFTANKMVPTSIIALANILELTDDNGKVYDHTPQAATPLEAPKEDIETWEVEGSKGKKYTVTRNGDVYSCSCVGFGYHRKCKHADSIKNAKNNG